MTYALVLGHSNQAGGLHSMTRTGGPKDSSPNRHQSSQDPNTLPPETHTNSTQQPQGPVADTLLDTDPAFTENTPHTQTDGPPP